MYCFFRVSDKKEYNDKWLIEKQQLVEFIKCNLPFVVNISYQYCIGTKEPRNSDPFIQLFKKEDLIIELDNKKVLLKRRDVFSSKL